MLIRKIAHDFSRCHAAGTCAIRPWNLAPSSPHPLVFPLRDTRCNATTGSTLLMRSQESVVRGSWLIRLARFFTVSARFRSSCLSLSLADEREFPRRINPLCAVDGIRFLQSSRGRRIFRELFGDKRGAVKERRRNERDGEENFVTFVTRLDLGGGGEGSLPTGRRNGPRGSPANVLRRKSSYRDLAPV